LNYGTSGLFSAFFFGKRTSTQGAMQLGKRKDMTGEQGKDVLDDGVEIMQGFPNEM